MLSQSAASCVQVNPTNGVTVVVLDTVDDTAVPVTVVCVVRVADVTVTVVRVADVTVTVVDAVRVVVGVVGPHAMALMACCPLPSGHCAHD